MVAYAAARGIMVVPEIEMPGHCVAALASYPNLSCETNGGPHAHAGRGEVWRREGTEAAAGCINPRWHARRGAHVSVVERVLGAAKSNVACLSAPAGSGEVKEVSSHWGVHEDVYCAVGACSVGCACLHDGCAACLTSWLCSTWAAAALLHVHLRCSVSPSRRRCQPLWGRSPHDAGLVLPAARRAMRRFLPSWRACCRRSSASSPPPTFMWGAMRWGTALRVLD